MTEPANLLVEFPTLAKRYVLSNEFLHGRIGATNWASDFLRDQTIVDIKAHVRASLRINVLPPERVERTYAMQFAAPASWWQHWKQDVAARTRGLRWIARRWPVRLLPEQREVTLTVDLKRFWHYPDAPYNPLLGQAFKGHHVLARIEEWVEPK